MSPNEAMEFLLDKQGTSSNSDFLKAMNAG